MYPSTWRSVTLACSLLLVVAAPAPAQDALDPVLLSAYERLDAGDVAGARQVFEQLVAHDPSYAEAHAGLATTSAARGDWSAVAREADAAVARTAAPAK